MGIELEKLTWKQAESALTASSIIVLPLGAASKEHGLHLPLNNDWITAEYFKKEILLHSADDIIVAPCINYSFYPAFVDYPGSISLSRETAAQMVFEICQSFMRFGPQKFYVWNNGISTLKPLSDAAQKLRDEGALLHYTNLHDIFGRLPKELCEQKGGSHADEVETSLMLAIAPEIVDMSQASEAFYENAIGRLSPVKAADVSHSPSGVWGNALLATRAKGLKIVEWLRSCLLADLESLRGSSPPGK